MHSPRSIPGQHFIAERFSLGNTPLQPAVSTLTIAKLLDFVPDTIRRRPNRPVILPIGLHAVNHNRHVRSTQYHGVTERGYNIGGTNVDDHPFSRLHCAVGRHRMSAPSSTRTGTGATQGQHQIGDFANLRDLYFCPMHGSSANPKARSYFGIRGPTTSITKRCLRDRGKESHASSGWTPGHEPNGQHLE